MNPTPNERTQLERLTRRALVVAAASLLATSCAGESNSSPDATPEATADSAVTAATVSDPADSTTMPETSTTTTTTTSTTVAPTTTLAPSVAFIDSTCTALTTAGYETRKATLAGAADGYVAAGGVGDAAEAIGAQCGEAFNRLQGAMEVEARSTVLADEDNPPIALNNFNCENTIASVDVTNLASHPIGVHLNFSFQLKSSDQPDTTTSDPVVVWSIEAGATESVEAKYVLTYGPFTCNVSAQTFDATPAEADAALATTEHPELTGDDPAVWFPALVGYEMESDSSGDIDRAAVTEDLRSAAYMSVVESTSSSPQLAPEERPTYTVCERGQSGPDADHLSLVYFAEIPERTVETEAGTEVQPASSRLRHGLFRRGTDGQWRWLSTAAYFDSVIYYPSCGKPSDPQE